MNRASGTPADGEVANVTTNIDDASAFNSVTVTCVDETDPNATQTATLTPTVRSASFTVPIEGKFIHRPHPCRNAGMGNHLRRK